MRSGAARGHDGYFHELALHGSDDELLDLVVPFLQGGIDAGEPTFVIFDQPNATLVREAMGEPVGLTFLPGADHYARPATTIKTYRELFAQLVAAGAEQIRAVGEVPHPGRGVAWDAWARYEAAVNRAYAEFPVWGMCPYDLRTTPASVLDEAVRTHPEIIGPGGGHEHNPRFQDPATFLRDRPNTGLDPLERTTPTFELTDPASAEARRAAMAVGAGSHIDRNKVDDLALAISEVVANAWLHGDPPVQFRLWTAPDRIVATVTDAGDGPGEPFVGLLPVLPGAPDGRGLWIAHQLCDEVTMGQDERGFTVRLVAGTPVAPPLDVAAD